MHDMWCIEPEDMHYSVLAERVRYFKEDEKGVATMCRAMEEMRKETAEAATFKAKVDAIIKIMKNFNITVQEAMRILEIPESEHARYMAAI